MKTIKLNKKSVALLVLAAAMATGCAIKKSGDALTSGQIAYNATDPNVDIPGVGSTSVPTQDAVIGRLLGVGLAGAQVTDQSTNTKAVIAQVNGNLPQLADPIKANGWDQIPLLTYAACADISAANTQAVYGVNTAGTLASQRNALVAAGLKIADQYVGGLATSGPLAAQATAIFQSQVDANALISGETVKQSFIGVCMAANVFGVALRGF